VLKKELRTLEFEAAIRIVGFAKLISEKTRK